MSGSLLPSFAEKHIKLLEEKLAGSINDLQAPPVLKESMLYSLMAGGKRIRPLLLFATLDAFNQETEKGLHTAAAIEMIHTYSLIHDDLPCMDDDDLRRGKPTNHKVFGEAIATLAGDALLTYSFQLIADIPEKWADPGTKLALIRELSIAAGAEGMVGGQVADMEGEGKKLAMEELEYIHIHKTGKLLKYSVLAGAMLANANEKEMELFGTFAHHLGLAFQIRDDILDLEGEEEKLGKRVGSDDEKEKNTYPSLLSMDGAKKALKEQIGKAKEALFQTNRNIKLLTEIIDLVENRDR